MATATEKRNFVALAKLEPRLLDLLRESRAVRPEPGKPFCANHVWYERFKEPVIALVGWEAQSRFRHPELGTPEAYDAGYQTIYDALPDCDHEGWC